MRLPVCLGMAIFSLITTVPLSAQNKRAFQLSDWYKVQRLSSPTLSPDGKTIAFVVTSVLEDQNRRHTEIWVTDVNGAEPRRMTSPGYESSAPRWLEGGKVLGFTSSRPGPGGVTSSSWAIRMDQGGEAYPVAAQAGGTGRGGFAGAPGGRGGFGGGSTAAAQPADKSFTITAWNGVESPNANPNAAGGRGGAQQGGRGGAQQGGRGGAQQGGRGGNAATDPYANMPPLSRPPVNSVTKPTDPARFDGMQFTDPTYKSNDQGYVPSTGRGGAGMGRGGAGGRGGIGGAGNAAASTPPTQLYIQRGTGERVALTSASYSHRTPSVSPDGKWVVFSADPKLRSDADVAKENQALSAKPAPRGAPPVDRNTSDLFLLPIAGCEAGSATCKPVRIENFGTESSIQWSPDSRMFSFTGRAGQYQANRLMVYNVATPNVKPVDVMGAAWPYETGSLEWLPDNTIRFSATTGGSNGIYTVNPVTREVKAVLGGRRKISSIQTDSAKTRMVYISTDMTHPDELYTANWDGSNEKKLTSFNDALNNEVAWSDAEQFFYKSVDSLPVEGWLMKPFGYQEGKKYPVVLYIHGGPHSAYDEGWFDEFQNLAAAGMFVLFTNPRGSSGTSNFFTNASRGDWGGKDYEDLMRAVDIVSKRPDIDSTRMGVTGGSYGGFMTAWITTKTNRFKAAQTDRMISDWTAWWGSSDAQSLTNGEFFGRPWENQAMYDSLSPIRFVQNVKTPTLLVQSEEDFRTPMLNAELWYTALKSLGVPAEFVRYPRSTHELSRSGEPWLLVDRLGRLRQWFTYWLIDGGPEGNTGE